MTCITSASMAVLINGEPTQLFKIYTRLRQGCALSPLLFILVIDTLNRGINAMKEACAIKSFGISRNFHLTHLLFVDNILHAGALPHSFYKIFEKFNGLRINKDKTEIITDDGDSVEIN